MVHLRENNIPIQVFSTRREAFTVSLKLQRQRPGSVFTIHQGGMPTP